MNDPYRTKLFTVRGTGAGAAGKRSRAITESGRRIGARRPTAAGGSIDLTETLRAAAPHQHARGRRAGRCGSLRTTCASRREKARRPT